MRNLWLFFFCMPMVSMGQGMYEYAFNGKLSYEVVGCPEDLGNGKVQTVEVFYHLINNYLAIRLGAEDRAITTLYDGRGEAAYRLIEGEEGKIGYPIAAETIDFSSMFGYFRSGDSPYEATGRTRAVADKMCREYVFESEAVTNAVWMEPNMGIKGQVEVQAIFAMFLGGSEDLPRGIPFSIVSQKAGGETASQLNIVDRVQTQVLINLRDYRRVPTPEEEKLF